MGIICYKRVFLIMAMRLWDYKLDNTYIYKKNGYHLL